MYKKPRAYLIKYFQEAVSVAVAVNMGEEEIKPISDIEDDEIFVWAARYVDALIKTSEEYEKIHPLEERFEK